jgi:hypothetical protein
MSGAGQVTFRLNVDPSNAKQGAASARDALRETGNAADKTTDSLKDLERQSAKTADAGARMGVLLGSAITAVSAAYLGLTAKAIKGLDDTYVAAQKLGTSTEFLSTLGVAAQQNSVGFDRLNGSLSLFSSNVARAAGGAKVQTQLFDQMGVSVRDANGHVKSLE